MDTNSFSHVSVQFAAGFAMAERDHSDQVATTLNRLTDQAFTQALSARDRGALSDLIEEFFCSAPPSNSDEEEEEELLYIGTMNKT